MTKLFDRFPEIMFIDGTYNVNGHGMPLYCVMVEDGHGRVVYYAATTEEDTLHLRKIMQCFKERNPKFSSTQVVVIDKDFAEWKMLTQEFPNAVVLFCQWHVLKVLFKELNDVGIEKVQREVARNAIRNVMYATDEEGYNIKKQQLFDATNAEFRKYFLENWESCVEMWAAFERDQYMHFGQQPA